jgi:2-oxoglutarate ferredoxin oxidoreductase subunit delta
MENTLRSERKATEPSRIVFNRDRCKGCSYCVYFCAKDVLEMSEETNQKGYLLPRVADESKCSGCRLCEAICPDFALRVISANADEEE